MQHQTQIQTQAQTFQSRWGYHPCDYETFKKLKLISKAYRKAIVMVSRWKRWKRKDPKNRVIRQKIRNDMGQVIGYEQPTPMPEPKICTVFTTLTPPEPNNQHRYLITTGSEWLSEYSQARKPQLSPSAVKPLLYPTTIIENMFQKVSMWLETTP